MTNDNQTALMMSIQRKKDRVEFLYEECKRLGIGTIGYERCSNEIVFLSREITEDEKLLVVERENVIEFAVVACNTLMSEAINGNEIMDTFDMCLKGYKEKYGTDGK